jgi:hypothetical protein
MEVIMEVEQTDENPIHCIYASAATVEFKPADLEELLSVSVMFRKAQARVL